MNYIVMAIGVAVLLIAIADEYFSARTRDAGVTGPKPRVVSPSEMQKAPELLPVTWKTSVDNRPDSIRALGVDPTGILHVVKMDTQGNAIAVLTPDQVDRIADAVVLKLQNKDAK